MRCYRLLHEVVFGFYKKIDKKKAEIKDLVSVFFYARIISLLFISRSETSSFRQLFFAFFGFFLDTNSWIQLECYLDAKLTNRKSQFNFDFIFFHKLQNQIYVIL